MKKRGEAPSGDWDGLVAVRRRMEGWGGASEWSEFRETAARVASVRIDWVWSSERPWSPAGRATGATWKCGAFGEDLLDRHNTQAPQLATCEDLDEPQAGR